MDLFEPIKVRKDFVSHRHSQKQYLRITDKGIVLASSENNTQKEPKLINPDFYSVANTLIDEFLMYRTRIILFDDIVSIELDIDRARIRINYKNKYLDLLPWDISKDTMVENIYNLIEWLKLNQFPEQKFIYTKLKAKPNFGFLFLVVALMLIAGVAYLIKNMFFVN
jgi:hypothetical protein